jgi:succinate dehydrogenase/fumarate reductase cytochrome b subunit
MTVKKIFLSKKKGCLISIIAIFWVILLALLSALVTVRLFDWNNMKNFKINTTTSKFIILSSVVMVLIFVVSWGIIRLGSVFLWMKLNRRNGKILEI